MGRKILVISLEEVSDWESCRHITAGLMEAYAGLDKPDKVHFHRISKTAGPDLNRSVSGILEVLAPDLIVFLDTFEVYGPTLAEISKFYGRRDRRPVLRFHAYGDFTLRAYLWLGWSRHIMKFPVEWVCASEQQRRLVDSLVVASGSVWTCPFPLRTDQFGFDASLRARTRDSLGFRKEDFIILYTGRLSLQKNVLALVRAFASMGSSFRARAKLVLAGHFDDISAPFDSCLLPKGGFHRLWQKEFARLSSAVADNIITFPGLPRQELVALLCAADLFASLSLVHDEDFGMAPAEAASTGLPLVLTKWGGYAGFQGAGLAGEWIPVHLSQVGPLFQLGKVREAFESFAGQKISNGKRVARARLAQEKLSIPEIVRILKSRSPKINKAPLFEGFKENMRNLSGYFAPERGHLIYPACHKGSTYEQIYRHYIEF